MATGHAIRCNLKKSWHLTHTIKNYYFLKQYYRLMMSVDMGCLICDAKFGFIIIFMDLKHSKFGSRPICFSKPYHVSHHKFICKILSAVLLVLCLGSFSLHVLRYVTSVVYAPPFSYVGKTTNGAMFHYMKSTRELRSYGLFCSK